MSHVRQQIREYFESQLSGLSTTGTNVFASRVYPLAAPKLPALLIYSQSESIEEHSFSGNRTQNRTLSVIVEGYVRGTSGFDDTLDTICKEVEVAILDAPTLGGLAINTELTSSEADYSGEGDQPVGTIRLTFEVQYRTQTGQPENAI
jgi:hypothetical protein